mmetsp:Transcript_10139/g.33261  ORF Transcript_10139/g.33261 Transcript_10139/m.33261 type:complete len:175 (+) Transcript_10139:249-773(+)
MGRSLDASIVDGSHGSHSSTARFGGRLARLDGSMARRFCLDPRPHGTTNKRLNGSIRWMAGSYGSTPRFDVQLVRLERLHCSTAPFHFSIAPRLLNSTARFNKFRGAARTLDAGEMTSLLDGGSSPMAHSTAHAWLAPSDGSLHGSMAPSTSRRLDVMLAARWLDDGSASSVRR